MVTINIIVDICLNKEMAESQRRTEVNAGLGTSGTEGYELVGCYQCQGYDHNCRAYFPLEQIQKEVKL